MLEKDIEDARWWSIQKSDQIRGRIRDLEDFNRESYAEFFGDGKLDEVTRDEFEFGQRSGEFLQYAKSKPDVFSKSDLTKIKKMIANDTELDNLYTDRSKEYGIFDYSLQKIKNGSIKSIKNLDKESYDRVNEILNEYLDYKMSSIPKETTHVIQL